MDFSGLAKWTIRIATAGLIIGSLLGILSAITLPTAAVSGFLDGFDIVISIFYYYVPAASVLFPLFLSMWGLSFIVLLLKISIMGLHTLWKTSE